MKHYILGLCIAFGAVNTAQASQQQRLPFNGDSMVMRLGEAVDRQVRRNFISSIKDNAIKFGTLVEATPQIIDNATLYRLDSTQQNAICFTNEYGEAPQTICTDKNHIGDLFNEKAAELDTILGHIDTRVSAPNLKPIIEQSMMRYTTIMNYVDEIKATNERSYQQIMKLM